MTRYKLALLDGRWKVVQSDGEGPYSYDFDALARWADYRNACMAQRLV
jgi:hypothetical protein